MPLPPATYIPTAEDFAETMGKYDERLIDPPPVLKQEKPVIGARVYSKDKEELDYEQSILVRLAQLLTTHCDISRKKGIINAPRFTVEEGDAIFDYINLRKLGLQTHEPIPEEQCGARFPIKVLENPKNKMEKLTRDVALAMMENVHLYYASDYQEVTVDDLVDWAWADRLPEEIRLTIRDAAIRDAAIKRAIGQGRA